MMPNTMPSDPGVSTKTPLDSKPACGTLASAAAGPSVLFVDQTAQLGGAELCLLDTVLARKHPGDRVVLFQYGPLASELDRLDIDVSVFPLGDDGESVGKSSGMIRKLGASGVVARLARRVASEARGMDLIYANTAKSLVVAALAGAICRKPVIYHLHDILSAEHFSRSNLRLLVLLANRLTTRVIANSHASAAAFVEAGGRADKVSVVYNGFDFDPFDLSRRHSATHRADIRHELGLRDQYVVALFGRFAPWKGQHVAIDALRRLPDVHLMLVGDALFGEAEYDRRIREQARRPEIAGRVHFLGFRGDVPALMQAADAVLHCSTSAEPFGRVIVEAMLSRRPVVATRGGGASEIVSSGENGFLVRPGSSDELIRAIDQIRGRGDRTEAMVERAFANARSRFDLKGRVDEINAVITQAAGTDADRRGRSTRVRQHATVNR